MEQNTMSGVSVFMGLLQILVVQKTLNWWLAVLV